MSDYGSKRVSGYGEATRYEFKWRCRDCGHTWKRTIATDNPLSVPDPSCPACKKAKRRQDEFVPFDAASGHAPALHGNNPHTKAVDLAAEVVMQDHGLTDIKAPSDVRAGEATMPRIAPHLQKMADQMFAPQRQLQSVGLGRQAGLIAQSALSGGYSPRMTGSPDPIAMAQAPRKTVGEVARIINTEKA